MKGHQKEVRARRGRHYRENPADPRPYFASGGSLTAPVAHVIAK